MVFNAVDLVPIRQWIFRIGHFAEFLTVIRNQNGETLRIVYPVVDIEDGAERHLPDLCGLLQINGRFQRRPPKADPATRAVVLTAVQTVCQRGSAFVSVILVRRFLQGHRFHRRLREAEVRFVLGSLSVRPNQNRTEVGVFPNLNGFCINLPPLRVAAIQRITDLAIAIFGQHDLDTALIIVGRNLSLQIENVVCVVVLIYIVQLRHTKTTADKVFVITLLRLAPLQFCEGGHARQRVVLHILETVDILAPNAALHTENVLLLFLVQLFRKRTERIDPLHGQVTVGSNGLLFWRKRLSLTEIEVIAGSHHHIVTLLSRSDAACCSTPAHNHRALADVALQNLVPADDAATTSLHHLLHAVHHVALQVVLRSAATRSAQSQLLNLRLTLGTLLPAGFRTFVAADVDDFGREDIHHFVEHIFEEAHRRFVASADHLIGDAPTTPHLVGTARTAELRERGQRCLHVSRQVDFRNDVDVTFGGIFHQLAQLRLSVETTVTDGVIVVGITPEHRALAPRRRVGESGIALDLHAPTLIVSQMDVKIVHIMERHHVNVAFHRVEGHEMAGHVEMHAAIGELRVVYDGARRELHHISLFADGNTLSQYLDTIEDTGCICPFYDDFVGGNADFVGFRLGADVRVQHQVDAGGGLLRYRSQLQLHPQEIRNVLRQELGLALQRVAFRIKNDGILRKGEGDMVGHLDLLWQWNYMVISHFYFIFTA